MKWIMLLVILGCTQIGAAQEWLGKSGEDIRRFAAGKGDHVVAGDTLKCYCQEEDERGRIFEVSYLFLLKDGRCDSYVKEVPLNDYWAGVVNELADQKGGKGVGETFEVEGIELFPEYRFEDFMMKVRIEGDRLSMGFRRA